MEMFYIFYTSLLQHYEIPKSFILYLLNVLSSFWRSLKIRNSTNIFQKLHCLFNLNFPLTINFCPNQKNACMDTSKIWKLLVPALNFFKGFPISNWKSEKNCRGTSIKAWGHTTKHIMTTLHQIIFTVSHILSFTLWPFCNRITLDTKSAPTVTL